MAQRLFRIPLINEPQVFDIDLSERAYTIICRYNPEMPAWQICMRDGITGQPLLTCLPLVTGVDLLAQYHHLGIPGQLFCFTEGDASAPPTLENLGIEGQLYYLVETEA
jgi:hypothetical protein